MFEQATIHLGATELLGLYFSSFRKNYKPFLQRVSYMHPETYKEIPDSVGCGWPPCIITASEASIEAEHNLNTGICCL
ncbi:hypothetical protein RIF29_14038 [Crotalaria pallida]|uniref:Uncharacterized protein n=1 Tax=Crotalaria pallida TaxID=3830 RepID=A0AAN9IB83_CROPI